MLRNLLAPTTLLLSLLALNAAGRAQVACHGTATSNSMVPTPCRGSCFGGCNTWTYCTGGTTYETCLDGTQLVFCFTGTAATDQFGNCVCGKLQMSVPSLVTVPKAMPGDPCPN